MGGGERGRRGGVRGEPGRDGGAQTGHGRGGDGDGDGDRDGAVVRGGRGLGRDERGR